MEGIDVIRESNPEMYVIFWLLIAGMTAMAVALKVLWTRNKELSADKDKIHDAHIKTALSATETLKDSLAIIQTTNRNVEELNKDSGERKVFESGISQRVESLEKMLTSFISEARKILNKKT